MGFHTFQSFRFEDGFLFQLPSTHEPKNLGVFGPAFESILSSKSGPELTVSQHGSLSLEKSVEVFAQDATWEFRKRMHSWNAIRQQVLFGLFSATSSMASSAQASRSAEEFYSPQFDANQVDEFAIEKLGVESIDDYLSIQNSSANDTNVALPTGMISAKQQRDAIQNRLRNSNIEQCLVRQGQDFIGAFATLRHTQPGPCNSRTLNTHNLNDKKPTDVLALFDLCVHRDFQGRSIGRRLLQRLMKKSTEQDAGIAVFATKDLAPYYQNLGFESILRLQRWSNLAG